MASNIVLKTYAAGDNNQGSVTPQNDALIYQCAIPMNGMFSGGAVTLASANVLHVAAGFGIIGGRFFEILESDIAVQLSASGSLVGRLYVHLSLTNADEPIEIMSYTGASLPALSGDPTLNITNGDFDMELCQFEINEITISNIVNTYPSITASNNQIRRATAYTVGDFALCQSADDSLVFICTTAGTTAVSEPVGYATVTAGNTVADGTAVFKAVSFADLVNYKADQSLIAPVETNQSSASQQYAVDEQFILNGLLSEATATIAQGSAFVLGGNYKLADSVTNQIGTLTTATSYNITVWSGKLTFNYGYLVKCGKHVHLEATVTVNDDAGWSGASPIIVLTPEIVPKDLTQSNVKRIGTSIQNISNAYKIYAGLATAKYETSAYGIVLGITNTTYPKNTELGVICDYYTD